MTSMVSIDNRYSEDQPRDPDGKFGSGGGGGSSKDDDKGAGDTGADTPPVSSSPRLGYGDTPVSNETATKMSTGSAAKHLVKNSDGTTSFTPERQALHDEIVTNAVQNIPSSENPTLYMMGGGPAAGKSSMLESGAINVPDKNSAVQINADDVRTKLPEYDQMVNAGDKNAGAFTHEEASHVSKRITNAAIERNQNMVLDGTGDSSEANLNAKIDNARANGYRVEGNYASVPVQMAVDRANSRGDRTGRYVPETFIRETYKAISNVFPKVAGNFDKVNLFDTSGKTPRLLATGGAGKLSIVDQAGYDRFLSESGD